MFSRAMRRFFIAAISLGLLLASFPNAGAVAAAGHIGAVYALTNAVTGNQVVAWSRAADGTLSPQGSYATGGSGLGAGLGSQGAVILSDDQRWLFAVNAGSNDISLFRVDNDGLTLLTRVPSGGVRPTSLTASKELLYVLNAGESGNITGFRIGKDGSLTPIANSTRPLSGSATSPAQVQFSPSGDTLVVTERATQLIDIYTVNADGTTGAPVSYPSSGAVPFGFAFGKRGHLVVSEAAGAPDGSAASSYRLGADGNLQLVSGSVGTHQGAACWVVVTQNGRFAYTANAATNSISGFQLDQDGSITLLHADGLTADTGMATGPADMALSHNSQFLYVRNGRTGTIGAFAVQADGSLQALPGAAGLPANSAGLAAR